VGGVGDVFKIDIFKKEVRRGGVCGGFLN